MKTAFCTHCSDNWFYDGGCSKLISSAKYFHPDIPFYVFGSFELDKLNEMYKNTLHWCNLIPVVSNTLADSYDRVVHFDADSFIMGELTELFENQSEIGVVRNNNDFDTASKFNDAPITYNNCNPELYANAGLVASTNSNFWKDWIKQNYERESSLPYREQDVLNHVLQSDTYTYEFLDPKQKNVHYGISSLYGKDSFWDSAKLIREESGIYLLNDKVVKVWHQAGGSSYFPKLQLQNFFSSDVIHSLDKIVNNKVTYEKLIL